jgi:hypothetical protein
MAVVTRPHCDVGTGGTGADHDDDDVSLDGAAVAGVGNRGSKDLQAFLLISVGGTVDGFGAHWPCINEQERVYRWNRLHQKNAGGPGVAQQTSRFPSPSWLARRQTTTDGRCVSAVSVG